MARIPSMQALRALDSFARHGTMWQAADELHLTRSAISHQLRLLERELGFQLLRRAGTRIELTPQGSAYAADIHRALRAIAGSAARRAGRGISGTLTVSCTPGFASSWLCARIGGYHATYPDVALFIITPRRLDDVSNPDADLFITFGRGEMTGMQAELLKEVEFTPMCSPALLNRLGGMAEPADILRATLLHLGDHGDWEAWLRLVGLPVEAARSGVTFADMNLVHAAALSSQGSAMGDEFICHRDMADGRLVRPFDISIKAPGAYYLAAPEEKADNPTVKAFRDWIMGELASE